MMAPDHPPVVTLAALYGAAGSLIGPRVAQRLGVPLLDREIPDFAAKRAGLSPKAVASVDEEPRGGIDRLVSALGRAATMSGGTGGSTEHLDVQERRLRGYIEEFLARSIVSGGVAVGRNYGVDGADPSLYHLMLDSTALSADACVEIIAAASRDRTQNPKRSELA